MVGIDSNGHRFMPLSKETRSNIELVDAGNVFCLLETVFLVLMEKNELIFVSGSFQSYRSDLSQLI